jgi:hypothetical protein
MTHAVEYIHGPSIGDVSACAHRFGILIEALDNLKRQLRKMNYSVAVIEDHDQLDDNILNLDKVNRITKGVFPFLWVNITCLDSALSTITQLFPAPDYNLYGEASMNVDIV